MAHYLHRYGEKIGVLSHLFLMPGPVTALCQLSKISVDNYVQQPPNPWTTRSNRDPALSGWRKKSNSFKIIG
jgi:hypothetical protein